LEIDASHRKNNFLTALARLQHCGFRRFSLRPQVADRCDIQKALLQRAVKIVV
jgi:hypothetical protein